MFSSNQFRFCSQKRWELLSAVFLKECKYIEKKVIRHISENLSDFSSDSDEEQIKVIRLMLFQRAISKMYSFREQFWKSNFESNFENVFFEGAILKMSIKCFYESSFEEETLKN